MNEKSPEWRFRIPQESEVNQDPIEGEFFTTQDVGDFADALVRESIQNSLDAKLPDKNNSVNVRYYFSGVSNANDVFLNKHFLFHGIYSHIFSTDNGLNRQQLPKLTNLTPYLVIEDFGTVGLDGSIVENDDPKTDSPLGHNFYWFWRNVGRSGKKGSERGKWGLGKTVFPASSGINTFFALTNRYDDNENFLMGLSVLKTHHIASETKIKRYPYGYFGNYDHEDQYFATPIADKAIVKDFRKIFNLKRGEDTSSGLSVIIPFPKKEINSKAIIRSILKQYFHPIIAGKLVVEVVDEDNKIDKEINDKTIFNILEEIDFLFEHGINQHQLKRLLELCVWSMNKDIDFINLKEPSINNTVMWRKDWFVTEKLNEIFKAKIDAFEEGERIAFNIPVKIQEINAKPEISWFKVFLEKDETLNESDSHFVRDGITISGIKKPKNKFIRSIVLIEDKKLVKLLGDAENPAHTEWQKNSSHFQGKYVDGDKVISFVEKSIDNLCSLLTKPAEGIDRDLMTDVFFIESSNEDEDEDEKKPNDLKLKKRIREKEPYVIESDKGGFKLKKNIEWIGYVGSFKIQIAYMVVKGNPLKKYSPHDFNLSSDSIKIESIGVSNLSVKLNTISFDVNSEVSFKVAINGFDDRRDLYINAKHYDTEV